MEAHKDYTLIEHTVLNNEFLPQRATVNKTFG